MRVNRKSGIRWLYEELPGLVAGGIVPEDVAVRLRAHYGESPRGAGVRGALVIFAVLGALLIGGGIILILAHNWDDLSKISRTALALGPLLCGQLLAGWVISRDDAGAGWREGSAVFLYIAIGSSLALVSQTYHLPGEFEDFLLAWMLFGLPVVYLLKSSVSAALYVAGSAFWADYRWSEGGSGIYYILLLCLVAPYIYGVFKEGQYSSRASWTGWVVVASTAAALAGAGHDLFGDAWVFLYSGCFSAIFLAGSKWMGGRASMWQRPLKSARGIGVAFLGFIFTFDGVWKSTDIGFKIASRASLPGPAELAEPALIAALVTFSLVMVAYNIAGSRWLEAGWGALAGVAAVSYPFAAADSPWLAAFVCNLFYLGLGVATMVGGLRTGKLLVLNVGLVMVSVLVIARFFDSDLPFLVRGLAFIAVGTGFLVTNAVFVSRMKKRGAP